jgi:hypothetical protein
MLFDDYIKYYFINDSAFKRTDKSYQNFFNLFQYN